MKIFQICICLDLLYRNKYIVLSTYFQVPSLDSLSVGSFVFVFIVEIIINHRIQ